MRNKAVRQVSKVTTRPASVRGINSYDSIVAMPAGFALVLRNLYAQPYGCQMRRGYRRWATGLNGPVETLCSHNLTSGTANLYAFVQDTTEAILYDVTTEGDAGVLKLDGLTNARWQHINFPNAAGNNLVAVNGADPLTWIQPTGTIIQVVTGDGSSNTMAGINPTSLIHVYAHQKRLWFVEKNSTRGWYLPPGQVFGTAVSFDFGGLWTRGGYLQQIITWTIDDGEGADDHLVAISSEGQVAVYKGTDPSGPTTWALAGVYYAGSPVGRRCAIRFGGDVMILTQFGVVQLSDLLKSTKVNPTQENNFKYVQQTISSAVSLTGSLFGWQPFIFPGANMVMLNVPASASSSIQFVMNDITKAWSEFLGYEAHCWELHDEAPFYGSLGAVYKAWSGNTDDNYYDGINDIEVLGAEVRAEVQGTFDYFEAFGVQKHFKMVRPTIMSKGSFALNLSVNVDFVFDSPLSPASFSIPNVGVWDTDYWDQAVWEGGLTTYKTWQAVTGIGTAASLRMLLRSGQETYWPSTDWLYENGGVM